MLDYQRVDDVEGAELLYSSEKWKCEEFNIKFPVVKVVGNRLGMALKKYHHSGVQKSG